MMKKFDVEIKGQRFQGAVAQHGNTIWYSLNGEVWIVESGTRTGRVGARGTTADPDVVNAPMPGKIIKVLVQKDSKVSTGETLIVMEAMKMEYMLKAAANGVVEDVACVVGQQVSLGASLVRLKTNG